MTTRSGDARQRLAAITASPADVEVIDDDGVRHRMWAVAADGEGTSTDAAAGLIAAASAGPITIADGHHRYETALRYRDERRMTRSCEEDPAFDYLLALLVDATEPLTVLPTHRLVRSVDQAVVASLLAEAAGLFDVQAVGGSDDLVGHFGSAEAATGGAGRIGVWTRSGGAVLRADRAAFESHLPTGGEALRGLDVTLLGVALERLLGIDADAVAGGAVAYTKSAAEAVAAVDDGAADVAFLLEGTPVAAIEAVARDGDVMPQKSTYFYPKALTGLVINPHEW